MTLVRYVISKKKPASIELLRVFFRLFFFHSVFDENILKWIHEAVSMYRVSVTLREINDLY